MVLLSAPGLWSQVGGGSETLLHWEGGAAEDSLGTWVESAGDINGDGVEDVLVGVPRASPGGILQAGEAHVYSGLDGSLIHTFIGQAALDKFGRTVSTAGDMDGDGVPDILVGAYSTNPGGMLSAGSAYAFSGASGQLLFQWDGQSALEHFGRSLSHVGDLNGDGFEDVLIGARYADPGGLEGAGSVFLYSGADGSLLRRWDGTIFSHWFGQSVSGIEDIDGDGVNDVLIGAYGASQTIYLYSGASGNLLLSVASAFNNQFGYSIADAGDIDQDGIHDIAVGAPSHAADAGLVQVFSGAHGGLLWEFDGEAPGDRLGEDVAGLGDVNGDGASDLLLGAPKASRLGLEFAGQALLCSGATGTVLFRWTGTGRGYHLGASVAAIRDLDGDGSAEAILGSDLADPGGRNRAGTCDVVNFLPYLRSNTQAISASAGGVLTLDLDFPAPAAFEEFKVLMSFTGPGPSNYGVGIPLSRDALLNRTWLGNYPFSTYANLQGTLDGSGDAAAMIQFPPGLPSSLIGRLFWLAAIANPPGQLPDYSSSPVVVAMTP